MTVTVWWAAPVDPEARSDLVPLLDDHERARMGALRRTEDRARYLAAHALARLVLATHLDTDPAALDLDRTCRCGAPHGKPRLAGRADDPGFSLTHSGALVGVAVGAGPVGIDVERHRTLSDLDGLARHALSPAERAAGPVGAGGFLVTWARKEALLKATGEGLASPMDAITLTAPGGPARILDWPGAAGAWWVADVATPHDDHPGAVAGAGPAAPRIEVADGDAVLSGVHDIMGR
ncbi:4'-phosphopantetheinyl transferase superfamily protein [Pseudonocardia sp. C8]|uniref:4'-phosphopantetheinyl transferase family protein n=1 Tax=Pseudonocardia sp. C8 TaxID=2762759 RepID=UPI00164296FC|nr:4'-phosphopantetheinyl transferase superfamily protein [Pseudonocardia sp. C8]MBC3191249.1 4'-phosphopantetheinyl transferase superfamily protein [Pseudonocardia sp. C8]